MILKGYTSQSTGFHQSHSCTSQASSILSCCSTDRPDHKDKIGYPDNILNQLKEIRINIMMQNANFCDDECNSNKSFNYLSFGNDIANDTVICKDLKSHTISVQNRCDLVRPLDSVSPYSLCNEFKLSSTGVFQRIFPDSLTICDDDLVGDRADRIKANSPGLLGSASSFNDPPIVFNTEPFGNSDDLNDDEVRRLLLPTVVKEENEVPETEHGYSERRLLMEISDCLTMTPLVQDSSIAKRSVGQAACLHGYFMAVPRPYLNFDKMQKNTLRRQRSHSRRVNKSRINKTRLPRFRSIRRCPIQTTVA